MEDSDESGASLQETANEVADKSYERLPKLVVRLTRFDTQIVRRSPRPKRPPSRYEEYLNIINSPIEVKKSRRKNVPEPITKDRSQIKRRTARSMSSVSSCGSSRSDLTEKSVRYGLNCNVLPAHTTSSDSETIESSSEENRPIVSTPRTRSRKVTDVRKNDGSKRSNKEYPDSTDQRKVSKGISKASRKDAVRFSECEVENQELVKTPKKVKRATNTSTPGRISSKIEHEDAEAKTPKRSVLTPKAKTPSAAIRKGLLTPSMQRRTICISKPATPLQNARADLHVSAVPKSLPCREEEFNNIYMFLEGKLMDNIGGCLYISGVPGTGKTATVNEAIKCLKKSVSKRKLNDFKYVEINGMKLTEPRQAYVEILKQLIGKKATWEQAHQLLDKRFTTAAPKTLMTVLLVDEFDLLCNKRQDVVYNLLDWPAKSTSQLVVITIANTMDLPEKVLMLRVTSRLGLTRLTFQPYTYKQLQEIVTTRLKDSEAFKSEAIQLVARKVAAVSGDARRALDICRRATEVAEINNTEFVSIQDVIKALNEMIASPKVQAIRHCSEMEKMFLQAVCAEVTRTGVEEVTFKNVYGQLTTLCSLEGVKEPTVTEAITICARLGSSRLLICEHSRRDIHQRILLNVSSDDIHFAMKNIEI